MSFKAVPREIGRIQTSRCEEISPKESGNRNRKCLRSTENADQKKLNKNNYQSREKTMVEQHPKSGWKRGIKLSMLSAHMNPEARLFFKRLVHLFYHVAVGIIYVYILVSLQLKYAWAHTFRSEDIAEKHVSVYPAMDKVFVR